MSERSRRVEHDSTRSEWTAQRTGQRIRKMRQAADFLDTFFFCQKKEQEKNDISYSLGTNYNEKYSTFFSLIEHLYLVFEALVFWTLIFYLQWG